MLTNEVSITFWHSVCMCKIPFDSVKAICAISAKVECHRNNLRSLMGLDTTLKLCLKSSQVSMKNHISLYLKSVEILQ